MIKVFHPKEVIIVNKVKNYERIHETVLKDALDIMDAIIDLSDGELEDLIARHKGKKSIRSIARSSNDLICAFPVMASRSISIDVQAMNAKAIEKNCVAMLQILFSAMQLSSADNAFEYIQNFHTNINKSAKLFDIDDVIGISDSLNEDALIQEGYKPDANILRLLKEDMRNLGYVLEPDVSTRSISESFTCKIGYNGKYAVEVKPMTLQEGGNSKAELNRAIEYLHTQLKEKQAELDRANIGLGAKGEEIENKSRAIAKAEKEIADLNKQIKDLEKLKADDTELERSVKRSTIRKNDFANRQAMSAITKNNIDILGKQVLNTEYKKANEMMPTLMIVNFKSKNGDEYETVESVIIGVKAKLYPIESEDIITHVVAKTKDANWVTKVVQASTREISFFRDFLFAIDKAKIDALSMSRKGSANKMWKVLERRAIKSTFNRLLARKNDATAITTLMVSQNEVDYIKKQFQIDLSDIKVARNLLDKYNLLGICIVDESLEISKFMWDTGEDMWETLAFSHLEKESNDNTYKKVVNLMTKIA